MQPNLNYKTFYIDDTGARKKNGIYCPVIDRWLLIDEYDHLITLETANCLSSKIATMVYVLPNNIGELNNENCLNYIIFDKTNEKKGRTSDLIQGQTPLVRKFNDTRQFLNRGYPEDFKTDDGMAILTKLKTYADFIQQMMYAIKICEVSINFYDNKTFSNMYFESSVIADVDPFFDKSDLEHGLLNSIKQVLYKSSTVEEATLKIKTLWETTPSMHWLLPFFEQNAKLGLTL